MQELAKQFVNNMEFRLGFFVKIVLWEGNKLNYGKIVKIHLSEGSPTYDIEFSIIESKEPKRIYTRLHNVSEKFIQLQENTETGLPFTATVDTHTLDEWFDYYNHIMKRKLNTTLNAFQTRQHLDQYEKGLTCEEALQFNLSLENK